MFSAIEETGPAGVYSAYPRAVSIPRRVPRWPELPGNPFPHVMSVRIEVADFSGSVGKHFMLWSLSGPSGHMSAEQPQYSRQEQQVMEENGCTARKLFVR